MKASPLAGKPAAPSTLVNVPNLVTAYYAEVPDPTVAAERVDFGTSGHRGSSLKRAFNEQHILAISQAICRYRKRQEIDGPLFLGIDTHALSVPALASALEVLAANGVDVMLAQGDEYTPTPAISHAILTHNRGRKTGLADGIVITPRTIRPMMAASSTTRRTAGPAEADITRWIEACANELLETRPRGCQAGSVREGASRADDASARLPERLRRRSRQRGRHGGDSRLRTSPSGSIHLVALESTTGSRSPSATG